MLVHMRTNNNQRSKAQVILFSTKNIFLSRFPFGVTEDNIRHYINEKCKTVILVRVEKIRLKEKSEYASFILHTGRDKSLFEHLINPFFWPPCIHVGQIFKNGNVSKPSLSHLY